jgi:hypothetical protein
MTNLNTRKKLLLVSVALLLLATVGLMFVVYQNFQQPKYKISTQADKEQATQIQGAPRLNDILKDKTEIFTLAYNSEYTLEYNPQTFSFGARVLSISCEATKKKVETYFAGLGVKDTGKLQIFYYKDKEECP